MSFELVRQVGREHPDLLPVNLGKTCYQHTLFLIEKLRANGHAASLICKSPGEGQYTPPGFTTQFVVGMDGKPYPCSGFSHDAIFCDGLQFDTLAGANEHDRPIYRRPGAGTDEDPNWSFDPNDGPQIVASPAWNEVPRSSWRANNPPFDKTITPAPGPTPPPPIVQLPSYGQLGDAAFFVGKIGKPLDEDMQTNGERMNAGSADWIGRAIHGMIERFMQHGDHRDADAIAKKVRNEWRAVMNNPKLPQL